MFDILYNLNVLKKQKKSGVIVCIYLGISTNIIKHRHVNILS